MPSLMCIDPGLQGTGVAIWDATRRLRTPAPVLAQVITSRGAESKDWVDRVNRISTQIQELAMEHNVRMVVCELMEMHQSARASMMWKSGDLQRTLFLSGSIYGMVESFVISWLMVPPSVWKGQLPKSVTINRVKRALGEQACRRLQIETHAWDAVGIGLWHMGVIK